MRYSDMRTGLFLVIIGLVFLFNNLGYVDLDWSTWWPFFLLIPGVLMLLEYPLTKKNVGILIPGTILTAYGALFLVNIYYGWHLMAILWPIFPLAVALGLFQLYFFGGKERALLIPIFVLAPVGVISLFFTLTTTNREYVIAVAFIAIGLLVILQGKRRREK